MKVKLFISVCEALECIIDGRADVEVLDRSLFFFLVFNEAEVRDCDACIERYAGTAGANRKQKMRAAHHILTAAMTRAQSEGRIAWPGANGASAYAQLTELLTGSGQKPPTPMPRHRQASWKPNYRELQDFCPHVEVVFYR